MSLHRRALVLSMAATMGASSAGCVPDHQGGPDAGDDGSSEDASGNYGSSDDGSGDDSVEDAPSQVGPDVASLDAAVVEASPTDGGSDSSLSHDANGASPEAAADAQVGTVVVTADASLMMTTLRGSCAAANSLVATPNQTHVGGTIQLTASGIDPSNQSSDVMLTWTATGTVGSLASSAGTSNTFTCASTGVEVVTVTASISEGGASCTASGSLMATLTCTAP